MQKNYLARKILGEKSDFCRIILIEGVKTLEKREWTNFIDELKRRNDIVDVISLYSAVQQKGRRFWARCPIHNEKTASLSIVREAQSFYCFGCHKGGDVIKFIEEVENFAFMEAVEFLAKRVNLPMPQSNLNSDDIINAKKTKDTYYSICVETARYFNGNLHSAVGKPAYDYLIKRGISKQTMIAFGLGYSSGFDGLVSYLKAKGVDMETAKKAGVVLDNKKGGYYDVLFGRMIVPIINSTNQVIAFGGRILEKRDDVAKYKNTAETLIFDKSKNLFGINNIKKQKTAHELDSIIIVEGYMDVIALYQAGVTNCVASMGTALTKEQARLIKRYTQQVYICYDGDSAGQNATIRGLDILRDEGLDVFVVTVPNGQDPDEFIRAKGVDEYRRLLSAALPLVAYKLKLLKRQFDINSPNEIRRGEYRRKYVEAALGVLQRLSAVERESYMTEIALETGFTKEFLERTVTETKDEPPKIINTTDKLKPLPPTIATAETKALAYIARAALSGEDWATLTERPYCFGNASFEDIFDYVDQCKQDGKQPITSMIYQLTEDQTVIQLIDKIVLDDNLSRNYFNDCIAFLAKKSLKAQIDSISDEYNSAEPSRRAELIKQISELSKRMNNINEVILTEDKNGNN